MSLGYLRNDEQVTHTVVSEKKKWRIHCKQHLDSISSRRCGSITYYHTVIRPAYCLFYLGDETLSADSRLQEWTRDADLMPHLEKHISEARWPSGCPHPLCNVQMQDETSFWYHLSDIHNLRKDNIKGRKRDRKAVTSEESDDIPFVQFEPAEESETSHRVKKKQKSTQLEQPAENLEVIDYSPSHCLKLSPTPTNGSPQERLAIFTDSISPTLTLFPSTCSDKVISCPTEIHTSRTSDYHDIDDFNSEVQWTDLRTDIMTIDLTEDKPLTPDDLISQYTTISSACSSVKGDGDDDIKGWSNSEPNEDVQIAARKPSIKLRLNPPKGPKPRILLRVKQPDQVSSPTHRRSVGKNNRRVRNPAPRTKKPGQKHHVQN
ncbi:MAG: hypothetical protein M1839_002157 [Geoglossum umbratile]|nr:MAG: hypothetical protein M1839_002157 [Geoglossum umbratile]